MATARLRPLLAAGLLALAVTACSGGSPGTPAATGGTAGAVRITIKDFRFSPDTATVHPGETVTVVNEDTTAHTLTAQDKSFDTGTLEPGRSATVTAPAEPGRYPYLCTIHPFMAGTLTVG
ncbi:cupredoxin domain-containing protein [Kitasatospora sp. NPDC058965]|uniref:cupredoxin domain-containing protein n=1 Tax=Kitasatospora sp. NPDC058965 TaxID=3346682 RepID=UPI0036869832